MQKCIIFFTYLRGIIHWLWTVFITVHLALIVLPLEWTGARELITYFNRLWARALLRFVGIRVKTKNAHHIPAGSFLMLFNHKSYVDIVSLMQVYPRRIYFGAKKRVIFCPDHGFSYEANRTFSY